MNGIVSKKEVVYNLVVMKHFTLWGILDFWLLAKLTKFKRILNYIKFLCTTFVANCSNVPNIYYSQKEFKHFGLEILVIHGI